MCFEAQNVCRWKVRVGGSGAGRGYGGMLPGKILRNQCILAHFHAVYFLLRKHHLSTGKVVKFLN